MWIDSHTHLNDQAYQEDYRAVIEAAINNGVEAMLVVGCDLESSRRAVELANEYPVLWAAVGIHPHDAKSWNQVVAGEMQSLLKEPRVVAVGEIGLDYHYLYSSKEDQLNAFIEQLLIAKQYNKPIIIHTRDAHQDTYTMLSKEKIGQAGGVLHCYSGSSEMARLYLELGLQLSFTGSITFQNADKLRKVAAEIPLDRLLVETDCPYLTPYPFRGHRNEPLQVALVGKKLAEVKQLTVDEVMRATTANCKNLFGI
jgi:TatD DNase family protein